MGATDILFWTSGDVSWISKPEASALFVFSGYVCVTRFPRFIFGVTLADLLAAEPFSYYNVHILYILQLQPIEYSLLFYELVFRHLYTGLCYRANEEIEKLRISSKGELAKLEASLKKADIRITGLEQTVEQKVFCFFHVTLITFRSQVLES